MKIRLTLHATMKSFFPWDSVELVLKEDATLADMFDELENSLGDQISSSIWNNEKRRFRGPVVVRSGDSVLKSDGTLLHDGQEIEIKRFLVGG